MKQKFRQTMLVLLALVLCVAMMAMPAAASSLTLKTGSFGVAYISNNNGDMHRFEIAACATSEEGTFVYSAVRPIQDQMALFGTFVGNSTGNAGYVLEEDSSYSGPDNLHRFRIAETLQNGSRADTFAELKPVKAKDSVIFLYIDESENFVERRTRVSSVSSKGIKTTDGLEKSIGDSFTCFIYNENNQLVGYCRNSTAYALAKSSGFDLPDWAMYAIIGGIIGGIAGGLKALFGKKKKDMTVNSVQYNPDSRTMPVNEGWGPTDTMLSDDLMNQSRKLMLVCRGGYLNGRKYEITQDGLTIGRDMDNTIYYPQSTPGISRHHVRLYWKNGQLMLADVGSSNGTFYQNRRLPVETPVTIQEGDMFYLAEKVNGFQIVRM